MCACSTTTVRRSGMTAVVCICYIGNIYPLHVTRAGYKRRVIIEFKNEINTLLIVKTLKNKTRLSKICKVLSGLLVIFHM